MGKTIQFGLGFVTGRPNVCKVINNTYEQLVNQFKDLDDKVELTAFVLFDLGYQYTTRVDFYGLMPNVYKDIKIKYITPEDIEEMKIKDFMWELDEILKSGKIIDFINTLSRNKLKRIIRKLIFTREELQIYDFHYKKGYTQAEVGKMLGVARQSINKKVKKMNEKMEEISGLIEEGA